MFYILSLIKLLHMVCCMQDFSAKCQTASLGLCKHICLWISLKCWTFKNPLKFCKFHWQSTHWVPPGLFYLGVNRINCGGYWLYTIGLGEFFLWKATIKFTFSSFVRDQDKLYVLGIPTQVESARNHRQHDYIQLSLKSGKHVRAAGYVGFK